MTLTEIILIGFSLSFDAMAVALAAGALHHTTLKQAFKIALFFGVFQLLMPFAGWALGLSFKEYVTTYGNIVGFMLIFGVGLNMLRGAFKEETPKDIQKKRHLAETGILVIMAIATSIDALVVGITFNFIPVNISLAVSIIGIITFALSFFAVYAGEKLNHITGNKIEAFAAFILIGLSFKILLGW